jgi:hypothetical protein
VGAVASGAAALMANAASAEPVALHIPDLKVSAPTVAVATGPSGALLVPPSSSDVAWWAAGSRPGDRQGTVVLAGHVDYDQALGVFFRLDELPVGAVVQVVRRDHRTISYRVVARWHVSKQRLPARELFRVTGPPALVLITCGGRFDPATKSYADNLVVLGLPLR